MTETLRNTPKVRTPRKSNLIVGCLSTGARLRRSTHRPGKHPERVRKTESKASSSVAPACRALSKSITHCAGQQVTASSHGLWLIHTGAACTQKSKELAGVRQFVTMNTQSPRAVAESRRSGLRTRRAPLLSLATSGTPESSRGSGSDATSATPRGRRFPIEPPASTSATA